MNASPIEVYRIIKMRIKLCFLLLLTWNFVFAQVAYMPYEFERYEKPTYTADLDARSQNFSTESEALAFYFLAYKEQRAAQPENYFPEPNSKRLFATAYLRENYAGGKALLLINFLENNGSRETCEALINDKSNDKILLPYKFLASAILENQTKQREYLKIMESKGMISNALSSFGRNSLNSIGNSPIAITQGLQDLIAIESALSHSTLKVKTLNFFVEKCKGYTGVKSSNTLAARTNQIWISPALSISLISQYQDNLLLSGIGFIIPPENIGSPDKLAGIMKNVGRNFAGIGVLAETPADRGMISSYLYFAEAYKKYASAYGESKDEIQSEKIYQYIEKAIE